MRLIILSCLIAISLGDPDVFAAEDPAWKELNGLFGKHIDSVEVIQVVKAYDLSKAAKGDSGSYSPRHHAYSLMFRGDRVSTIVIQVSEPTHVHEHWRKYSGDFPAGIKREHTRKNIIEKFGKSNSKSGNTWLVGDMDIWISFNDKSGAIDEIYVSKNIPSVPNKE